MVVADLSEPDGPRSSHNLLDETIDMRREIRKLKTLDGRST